MEAPPPAAADSRLHTQLETSPAAAVAAVAVAAPEAESPDVAAASTVRLEDVNMFEPEPENEADGLRQPALPMRRTPVLPARVAARCRMQIAETDERTR